MEYTRLLWYHILRGSALEVSQHCLNGGLFGVTSITFTLAEHGQLPSRFKREIRASSRGLTISALLALLMVNLLSLTTVASLAFFNPGLGLIYIENIARLFIDLSFLIIHRFYFRRSVATVSS